MDIIDEFDGSIGFSQVMITAQIAREDPPLDVILSSPDQYQNVVESAKHQYLAVAFLSGTDAAT